MLTRMLTSYTLQASVENNIAGFVVKTTTTTKTCSHHCFGLLNKYDYIYFFIYTGIFFFGKMQFLSKGTTRVQIGHFYLMIAMICEFVTATFEDGKSILSKNLFLFYFVLSGDLRRR